MRASSSTYKYSCASGKISVDRYLVPGIHCPSTELASFRNRNPDSRDSFVALPKRNQDPILGRKKERKKILEQIAPVYSKINTIRFTKEGKST